MKNTFATKRMLSTTTFHFDRTKLLIVCVLSLLTLSQRCAAVESPLETINNELKAIKTQMNSVQQSLITSVGLLQDQLSEFSSQVTSKLDSKLTTMDSKLGALDGKMSQLQDRAHVWDTLQHHVTAWNSLMKSVDDKIIHISRSQDDKFLQQSVRLDKLPTMEFKLETVSKKVDDIGSQLQIVDTRLMSLQDQSKQTKSSVSSGAIHSDVAVTLQKIEAQLKNISTSRSNHRGRGSRQRAINNDHGASSGSSKSSNGHNSCHENREILQDIQSKVDVVYDKSNSEDYNNDQSSGPRFDYLRSQPPASEIGVSYDLEDDFDESENNFVRMFRKLATPFKKANKRLKAMEDIQGRFDTVINELQSSLKTTIHDMETKFNEFYTMSYEMFEQQSSEMERYSANFAELLQCCKGHSGDFDRFKASASPVLTNLDSWMVTWSATANQKFDRVLEQHRYNTNRLVTGNKELERILTEGFDRCNAEKVVVVRRRQGITTEITTVADRKTTERSVVEPEEEVSNDQVEKNGEGSEEPKPVFFRGCEDLRKNGEGESKVFTVGQTREINEQQRDFNRRFCDQETSGGGWTVIQRRGDYGEPRVNFTRPWVDYKHGFGDLYGEFWFGNDYISELSTEQSMMLRIELEAHNGTMAVAEYTTFRVDGESVDYRLWVGGYSGNATDSLSNHNGYKFSTIDRNNDEAPQCCPCAPAYGGGWWFYSCFEANLNGEYFSDPLDNGYYRGIIWELWLGDYSLKSAKMMIRPRDWNGVIPVPPDP